MSKSALTQKENEVIQPNLSKEEETYLGGIASRLLRAKMDRDQKHPEFNDMSFLDYYQDNERIANTYVHSKQDGIRDEQGNIIISSGTVEQKLQTLVAEIVRLNLGPEVRAFNKQNKELVDLGMALTDVIVKTAEWENDDEGRVIRTTELLKQGTVFIQERWDKIYKNKKTGVSDKDIGKIKDVSWNTKLEKVFEGPRKRILYAPGVYLGNIREYTMERQPFVYTVNITSYQEAMSRYGGKDSDGNFIWERWKNVPRERREFLSETTVGDMKFSGGFSLFDDSTDKVEEIHYQDAINNEFQILLNGVPMLPVGFPLSAVTPDGNYNIEKQALQVINPQFAYGRSFTAKTKHFAALIDEVIRLLVFKTRKSIHPPYANISGKVISPKSLNPGRITMGIDPNSLVPIGQEGQGATAAEYQMLKELKDGLDRVTISPQVEGMQTRGGTTAFEVGILTQQAQKIISLTIGASVFMEQKLGYLRLHNILANYFNPVDTQFDDAKQMIKNVYRTTSRRAGIEGRGSGIREVIPIEGDDMPDPNTIMDMEDFEGTPEPASNSRRRTRDELGMEPIKKIFLNQDELKKTKLFFKIEVESREKDTSASAKRMFREELRDIAALAQFGSQPNISELEERHARVWGRKKERLFSERQGGGLDGTAIANEIDRINQAEKAGAPEVNENPVSSPQ